MYRNFIIILIIFFIASCTNQVNETVMVKANKIKKDTLFQYSFAAYCKGIPDTMQFSILGKNIETAANVKQFYTNRNNKSAWLISKQPNDASIEMFSLIKNSMYYGLDTSFYNYAELKSLYLQIKTEEDDKKLFSLCFDFEIMLTNSCFLFLTHLEKGVLYPDTNIYKVQKNKFSNNLSKRLEQLLIADNFSEEFLKYQPDFYQYVRLQKALTNFLDNNKLIDTVLYLADYKRDSVKCYNQAAERLVFFEFLDDSLKQDTAFFFKALREFQIANGMQADGEIGRYTARALTKNNYERYQQIVINLERLRWEQDIPEYYIFVNIPSYELKTIENDSVTNIFKVITGRTRSKSPILTGEIEFFTTYPVWYVPSSISTNEMLPKLKKDSTYLKRNNYRLYNKQNKNIDATQINWDNISAGDFNYKVSQNSGGRNALGSIKFIFPNKHHVYLHDTPNKRLFNNSIRAYSHGCIRLHNPVAFGCYILEQDENKIESDSLRAIMKNRVHKRINLNKHVPIHIRYISCLADSNNNVIFYLDIYKRDNRLLNKMQLKFRNTVETK